MAYAVLGELARTGSHHVDVNYNQGIKEQVFCYIRGTWRGEPCIVEVQCDRYTHSAGLSEWRAWVQRAEAGTMDDDGRYVDRGNELSETARARFRDDAVKLAMAWLASDAYRVSEHNAYTYAMLREFDNIRPWDNATRRVRETMAKYRAKLSDEHFAKLIATADAYDIYSETYRQVTR